VANNPNIGQKMGFARGFDHFVQKQEWSAEAINTEVEAWEPELRESQQYFLYLHYMDTHRPYQRHDPWFDSTQRYADLARYDSAIGYVDSKIRELYESLSWQERTLIVLLADHGEEFRDHGGEGHTNQLYDELLHVPLVFWQPGVIRPARIAEPVSLVDVRQTLEELASGQPSQVAGEGVSLVPALAGRALSERPLFAMRWTETQEPPLVRKAVLRGRWKYIRSWPGEHEELYDRSSDPDERHNLVADEAEVAAKLRSELGAFEARARRHERAFVDSEQPAGELEERLRSLGYVH
jgi:arylsulfatase A-like enzyme